MPIDDMENLPPEERGLQNEGPAKSGDGDSGDFDSPDYSRMSENEARLDEIETLLHELSSEFRPTSEAVTRPQEAYDVPGFPSRGDNDDTARLPTVTGFDLNKPVDYYPDPERYDHRRVSEIRDDFSLTAQSMARRLAPSHAHPSPAPYTHLTDRQRDPAPPEKPAREAMQEPSRTPKRRMRLRPARRVSGSRPEPRVTLPNSAPGNTYGPPWSPGHRAHGQSGRGLALGAVIAILFMGGATATIGMVKPLRSLLPDRLAQVFEEPSPAVEAPVADRIHLADAGNIPTEQDSGSFTVASDPAEAPTVIVKSADRADHSPMLTGESAPAQTISKQTEPLPEPDTKQANVAQPSRKGFISGNDGDKSSARLDQDPIVQATLKDPEKRALKSANENAPTQENSKPGLDPIVTGSVAASGQKPQEQMAPQHRAGLRIKTVKTTPVPGRLSNIAGLGRRVQDVDANAYAPSPADVGDNVPFPGAQTNAAQQQAAYLTPQTENLPQQSAGHQPLQGIDSLLARGHELLQTGQIASARLMFRRVASMGDERGAKGMGMTFDPAVYATLPVAGVTPDREKAEFWYRKARELAHHKRIPDAGTDARSVEKN